MVIRIYTSAPFLVITWAMLSLINHTPPYLLTWCTNDPMLAYSGLFVNLQHPVTTSNLLYTVASSDTAIYF